MKKLIALLLVLSVVLFACAKTETKVTQTSTPANVQTTTPSSATQTTTTTTAAKAAAEPNINALEASGEDCLKENVKVCLPVNYATASFGDTLGFAFGIKNQFPDAKRFSIKLSFVETRESLGEVALEEDKDTMKNWLSVNNLQSYYDIPARGTLSKPILINVKNMISPSKQTVPGAYVFEIQAQTYDGGFYTDYGGPQQVTVRIK